MAKRYHFEEDEPDAPARPCDHPGCTEDGAFPAPKSRQNLREYYHFCLDHIREYNKQWDFFKGYSQEQIYEQIKRDTQWDRPSWPVNETIRIEQKLHDFVRRFTKGGNTNEQQAPSRTPLSREAQAMDTLGLTPNSDIKAVKIRYRELVKRYHPDKNPDNPKAAERFKVITEAYTVLRVSMQGK